VLFAEGLATESFLPGPQIANSFDAPLMSEIMSIFLELDPDSGASYGPAARRTLCKHEAQVLLAQSGVA
jgi:hypothetical protein